MQVPSHKTPDPSSSQRLHRVHSSAAYRRGMLAEGGATKAWEQIEGLRVPELTPLKLENTLNVFEELLIIQV